MMELVALAHGAANVVLVIPGGYDPTNAHGIPGSGTLMDVASWAGLLVLGLCVLGLIASIAGLVFGRASGNAGVGIISALALPVFIVGVILDVNAASLLDAFAKLGLH